MRRLAHELKIDPAELRMNNFIKPEQFPYTSPTGCDYDSGDYRAALDLALRSSDMGSAQGAGEARARRAG